MIPELREDFNQRWTERAYTELLHTLEADLGEQPQFRIAETPIFLPESLLKRIVSVSYELLESLLSNQEFLQASETAIPESFRFREPRFAVRAHQAVDGARRLLLLRQVGLDVGGQGEPQVQRRCGMLLRIMRANNVSGPKMRSKSSSRLR